MKRRGLICLAAVMLAGCGALVGVAWTTVVVDEQNDSPAPTSPLTGIKAHLESTLKDPFSAQVQGISVPTKGYSTVITTTRYPGMTGTTGEMQELRRWGWVVKARVNAKNSYGGYVGWHDYKFVFRGEQIIYAEDETSRKEEDERAVQRFLRS